MNKSWNNEVESVLQYVARPFGYLVPVQCGHCSVSYSSNCVPLNTSCAFLFLSLAGQCTCDSPEDTYCVAHVLTLRASIRVPAVSQELAEEVKKVVEPLRDQLDAVVVFPSMPEVMRLNKVGSFTMQNLGQSKSVVSDFMKKKKKVRQRMGFAPGASLCCLPPLPLQAENPLLS